MREQPANDTNEIRATLARRVLFSSAHFYNQKQFTAEKNRETFGLCYTPYGHGHNYILEVFVSGPIDPHTKLVIDLADLDAMLKEVAALLDHRHLNFDIDEFKAKIPTTENIALYLHEAVLSRLKVWPTLKLDRLRLYETDDLWAEVTA